MSDHSSIPWREWGDDAFAEARAQDKPILLDIGAVWCHWCHVMDTASPATPSTPGPTPTPKSSSASPTTSSPSKWTTTGGPDINARYNMGGWPTTAFLTPDGDTLYGETYVPPPRMVALLDYIADIYHNRKDEVAEQTAQMRAQRGRAEAAARRPSWTRTRRPTSSRPSSATLTSPTAASAREPKFPHPDALLLALEQYALTGDPELRDIAEKTLHGMADGGMYDQICRRLLPLQHDPRLEHPAL